MASLTHDYDGESIRSMIVDDKIKVYSARLGIGPSTKKYKDGNQVYVPPEPS